MLWRGHRYQQIADGLRRQQEVAFRAALPGQPVPVGITSRLAGEDRRLLGVAGDAPELPAGRSALPHLHDLLTRVPPDVRLRVLEVRIDDGKLIVDGQARTHGDAEALAVSLRRDGAFVVDEPRTEQLGEGGVSFTLAGGAAAARRQEGRGK
jgi:hypothetical protein